MASLQFDVQTGEYFCFKNVFIIVMMVTLFSLRFSEWFENGGFSLHRN